MKTNIVHRTKSKIQNIIQRTEMGVTKGSADEINTAI